MEDLQGLAAGARADLAGRLPAAAPAPQLFLAGHSLGGLVAATLAAKDQAPFAGLLLCSPAMDVTWSWTKRRGRPAAPPSGGLRGGTPRRPLPLPPAAGYRLRPEACCPE